MGFDFDGYVLRPPRVATGNAQSTGEATSGVDRDHKTLSGYTSGLEPTGRPPEPFADAYRAAVLLRTDAGAEYLLWAANNGSLTTVETPDYAIEGDTNYVSAISGTLTVTHTLPPPPTTYTDGTDSFTVKDAGGRSIYTVTSLVLTRGDTDTTVTAVLASQDMTTGKVVLDAATLTLLGGGFSPDRGDSITSVEYVLARVRYWWTRNDASLDRFGWDGAGGRWAPLKGQPVLNLGPLVADTVYTLGPKPTRFAVGDYLPGNPSNPDEYALVRVGMTPDSTAIVPLIEVVSDTDAATAPYPFSGPSPDAVVGVTNGKMQFNPTFLAFSAGQTVWYNAETYVTGSSGKLGPLTTANTDPLFLSPIPGPTERPFVRLGFRTHLTPVPCDTDADLPAPSGLTSGYFAWSRTTGKMVFAQDDVDRATPGATGYELAYLKTEAYFDGVALNTQPLPTKAPVQLVDDTGTPTTVPLVGGMYVPLAEPVPFPGISGVRYTPNGSGMTPDLLGGNPTTRVNGDDTGLTRTIEGIGDTFIFTPTRAMETLEVVEYDVGLTNLAFTMSKTLAQVSRQAVTGTLSRAQFKRAGMVGEKVYFLQADVTPATYADEARVYSRLVEPFTLTATDTMRFAIDGVVVTWVSSLTGDTLTAASVAADLQAAITAAGSTGTATVVRGRIVISSANLTGGMVEVGWNADPDDLTGQAALGFLPGWKVDLSDSTYRWLPDNGASFGVYRSPVNLDGTGTASDFCSTGRFDRKIVTESLPGTPTFYTNLPPLLDIPGFAPDVHYASTAFLNVEYLRNYDQLLYEFDLSRFSWLETYSSGTLSVPSPTALIALGHTAVVPETLDPDAMLDTDYGLQLRLPGGVYTPLVNGTDFLFPDNGGAGQVALSTPVSPEVGQGNAGFFSEGSVEFSDLNVSDWSLTLGTLTPEGYRLAIRNGDALGSYVVAGIDPGDPSILLLMPDVPFPASAGPADSLPYASWEVFSGYSDAVYDPSIVADVQAVPFAYLSDEVFRLLLLSSLGAVESGGTGLFTAYLADALASDREVSLRFGVGHDDPTATLTYIQQGFTVGVIAPTGLVLPTTNAHFATGAFRVRIGGTVYEGASLVGVSSFPPSPILGDIVYYGTSLINEGQLRFGTTTLLLNSGCVVVYDEVLSDTTDLAAGAAEANPSTGEVVISSADATAYAGSTLYLVEQTVLGTDVQVSPIVGGVFFKTPLREGQVVEARYYQANTDGTVAVDDAGVPVPIVEYLSNVIRLEVATAVSTTEYSFNPTGKTVDTAFATSVWVGPNLQNYGGRSDVSVSGNTLTFTAAVDPAKRVRLNYAVLEAFGGEQTYSTSVTPVYRPPFYLEAGQDTFTVEGDRTSEFAVGTLFTVGGIPFYTKATSYDGTTGQTSVTIWPTPTNEVGSRAPANDASTSLSSVPVALIVDPEDPVTGGGNTGFLLSFPSAVYVPVNRGEAVFTFAGDYTKVALRGHLLEVGGYPFIIVGSELVIEGRYTRVYVNNPAPTGLSLLDGEFVYLSSRPVYPNTPVQFTFKPWLPYETVEVVLYGGTDENGPLPGRTLVDGVDFTANPATGTLTLKAPSTPSLLPTQRLVMSYYAANIIGPQVQDGAVVVPTYSAQMKVRTAPSTENGYLGRTLVASYTFAAPDSFYMQVAPLEQYLGDVAQIALGRVQAQAVSGGPSLFSPGSTTLSKQGAFGLRGQVQDARDQDRAARVFLSLYNEVIVDFEQVLENIDGRIIGDRDGKFKFFVGRGLLYSPPGYEDPFTGDLNTRLVWSGVFSAYNPDDLLVTTADPLVDPATGTSTNPNKPGAVDGKTPDPATLSFYVEKQRLRVLNDMDDVMLVGFNRPGWATLSAALLPFIDMKGRYLSMWEPHLFSRLFPERTKAFTTTLPGLEANLDLGYTGFYTFARFGNVPGDEPGTTKKALVSTLNTTTAIISNPALGVIEGINDSYFRPRGARARIWAYSATGFPELGGPAEPSLIATPLPFAQFPIDPDTGLPDFAQLASGGGDLFDLVSGDPDLSTPGFAVGQTLAYGQPDGDVFTLGDASTTIGSFLGSITPDVTTYANVCVKQVVSGCVLVLGKSDLTIISASDVLVVETGTVFDPAQGDTIYVSAPLRNTDAEGYSDPPTAEELASIGTTLPAYRTYFDLITANKRSEIRDLTLPSWDDPNLGLKEILGQNPPSPLMPIEGDIAFTNTRQQPAQLPALLGQARDDSGDVSIPYLSTTITELNLLGQVANEVRAFFGADTTVGLPVPISAPVAEQQTWKAVYPDEIVGADGSVLVSLWLGTQDPATLYTSRDLTPVAGSYTNRSAIGDVRPFDLLLVEAAQGAIPVGAQGVLSVGAVTGGVSGSSLEVPRFVTPTTPAQPVKYTVTNAVSQTGFVGGLGGTGLLVTSPPPAFGVYQTVFDFSDFGAVVLADGTGTFPGVGGYNRFLGIGGTGNALVIRIYDTDPASGTYGALIEAITISDQGFFSPGAWGTVLAPAGISLSGSPPNVSDTSIIVETAAPLSSVANSGIKYGVTVTADAYIDGDTFTATGGGLGVNSASGTTTAAVERDRLTFSERMSLATAAPRGTVTSGAGVNVETTLAVYEITVGTPPVAGCTVNAPDSVNNPSPGTVGTGLPFTFLTRYDPSNPAGTVGTFTIATTPGTERGTIKVMSWEANGNVPLSGADLSSIKFSAVPSSDAGETSLILEGEGTNYDRFGAPPGISRAWLQDITVVPGGAIENVQPGDIVVADGGPSGTAAVKTGTYLVRHAVPTNGAASDGTAIYNLATGTSVTAGVAGAVDLTFPQVLNTVDIFGVQVALTVDTLVPVTESPTGYAFASGGRLYFILKPTVATYNTTTLQWELDPTAVYFADYGSLPTPDPDTGNATFTLTAFFDATNAPIPQATFLAAVTRGMSVSGMLYLPLRRLADALPANNCVGYALDAAGNNTVGGVAALALGSTFYIDPATPGTPYSVVYDAATGNLLRDSGGPYAPNNLYVQVPTGSDSTAFYAERDRVVYPSGATPNPTGVAAYLDVGHIDWDDVHFGGTVATAGVLSCLLPGDKLVFGDDLVAPTLSGFVALSGVFLEPSFPLPTGDLGQTVPHVVSASYTATSTAEVGVRNYSDYFAVPPAFGETVHFYVRRIRRFHEAQQKIVGNLELLKPVYETRRGLVLSYNATSRAFVADTSTPTYPQATNIGAFTADMVNINPGDLLRLLDSAGVLLEEAEVEAIVNPITLRLKRPGLSTTLSGGETFEVYLRQAPVPHEQSCEQLLALLTDEVVLDRRADYSDPATTGGQATAFNVLSDTDPTVTYYSATVQVQVGDYVVVDPAGTLFVPTEEGMRPVGDRSVSTRLAEYIAGKPDPLDDNRGFYRVATDPAQTVTYLEVDGASRFGGGADDGSDDVVYGGGGAEYAVLPTIHASSIGTPTTPPDVREGQQSLRPTAASVGGSFLARDPLNFDLDKSITPFSYRIIRPSSVFSQDATELILFMRERMLSWIEEISGAYDNNKGGDYWTFQDEDHIKDVGSPTSPADGLGVISNEFLVSLIGLIEFSPFANTSDCLSVLDRRFWVLDTRLDGETPVGIPTPYADLVNGTGRPVLPDLVNDVLDNDDRFRALRFSWVVFRADRVNGSLQALTRARASLPEQLAAQRQLLLLKKGLGS
jgi:hypothetical protein